MFYLKGFWNNKDFYSLGFLSNKDWVFVGFSRRSSEDFGIYFLHIRFATLLGMASFGISLLALEFSLFW